MGYLQYTLVRLRWKPNTSKARLLQTIIYINRRKIRTSSKCQLQLQYCDQHLFRKGMHFWFIVQPSLRQYRNSFLCFYNRVFHITPSIEHWLDTEVEDVCTALCDWCINYHAWEMTFMWRWEIIVNEFKISRHRNNDAVDNYSLIWSAGTFCDWQHRTMLDGVKPQQASPGHEG